MKRILAVLVLLALCGMAFSVTGKVFTTIRSVTTDSLGTTIPVATGDKSPELFGDTGFVLNFDGFDVKYVMKAPSAITINGGVTANALAAGKATSPGMIGIENIKAGDMVNAGVDVIWYTLGTSASTATTNPTATNNTVVGYNSVEFDPLLTITLSDVLKLDINDHQAIKFYGGSYNYTDTSATNVGTIGGSVFKIPLRVTYSGIENVALSAEIYDDIEGDSQVVTKSPGTTNSAVTSIFNIGAWVCAFYTVIPDTFKVGAQLQIESQSKTVTKTGDTSVSTNITTTTSLPVTILVEAVYNPASKVTLRLGGGYKIPMGDATTQIIGNGPQTTNVSSAGAALVNWDPMVEFGGGYDVTENFNIGIEGRMYFWPAASSTSYTKGTIGSSTAGGIINFQNGNYDDPAAAEVNFTYKF